MEPERSEGADAPLLPQNIGVATGEDVPPPYPDAPRDPRVTRALEPEGAPASDAPDGPSTVERSAWLRDEEYWRTVTYMSATGRRPGDKLATRPLPRPERFRASSPMRSATVLALVIALIFLIPIGVVIAGNAASHITIPNTIPITIPGISQPTATPTPVPTHAPTPTPKKKK
ncbi:MAG TPA: hypothetical protein VFQ25_16145 [Ktedonobacterales bacterium]|nr:hypothetical protein [Ktedonobacterales bacterium]